MVERMVDRLAAELAMDPVELRRRNLLTPEQMPYTTPTGAVYDSADYGGALERVVELAGYDELRAEQARRRAAGDPRLLGIGVSVYVEVTGGFGQVRTEYAAADLALDPSSPVGVRVTVRSGASAHGQGHATSFAQIAADALGLPMEAVTVVQGDTDLVPRGVGTFASRSVQLGGSAVRLVGLDVVERARRLAAELLEAAEPDVVAEVVADGTRSFAVQGVPARSLAWRDLVAHDAAALAAELDFDQDGATYPFGAHLAVVEVDAETGACRLLRLAAVDDCGTVINPLLADGQIHGGLAQGASQALYERMAHDDFGNPLTATFADYALPSAAELPSFELARTVTPTPLNPLGAKGIGESGTIGATPAVHNAVVDALAHLGVRHVDMPCPPERLWRAIRDARAEGSA
jgi:carbon-monoxide dehydrogenase large subunit